MPPTGTAAMSASGGSMSASAIDIAGTAELNGYSHHDAASSPTTRSRMLPSYREIAKEMMIDVVTDVAATAIATATIRTESDSPNLAIETAVQYERKDDLEDEQ